jgi:hypothetical protein
MEQLERKEADIYALKKRFFYFNLITETKMKRPYIAGKILRACFYNFGIWAHFLAPRDCSAIPGAKKAHIFS